MNHLSLSKTFSSRVLARAGVALAPLALATIVAPAAAQTNPQTAPTPQPVLQTQDTPPADTTTTPDVVVTGSLFRNPQAASASPITVLSAQDLATRGINTVSDALQSLAANNGGTLNSNWSQFGFPKGAARRRCAA